MSVRFYGSVAALIALATPAVAQVDPAEEAAALRAELAAMRAQMTAMQNRLDRMEAQAATGLVTARPAQTVGAGSPSSAQAGISQWATAPVLIPDQPASDMSVPASSAKPAEQTKIGWKGSPLIERGDARFKVKGRIQYDAGYLITPDGVADKATGFSNELRRLRLGAEGQLGAGFGYKLELELSDNESDLVDTYISYERGQWLFMLGNQNSFQSLDELIGDTSGSVMERAAFTDAFGFERRLGFSAQYRNGPWLAQAGIFTDSADSLANSADGDTGGDENDSFSLDGRLVYAPKIGTTQLHLAGSMHWRELNRLSDAPVRYRQRPYLHSVNSRYLSTPEVSETGEAHYGVEVAAIRGPLHVAGEMHWLRALRPGLTDPTFFGGYAEIGYYLTRGDTRGYGNGIFGTANPARPVNAGGPGAIQLNLRYDYLNLNDAGIIGGTQKAVIAGLIWTPIQYLRFNANYAHLVYTDAAILAGNRRNYGVDTVALRAELDF